MLLDNAGERADLHETDGADGPAIARSGKALRVAPAQRRTSSPPAR